MSDNMDDSEYYERKEPVDLVSLIVKMGQEKGYIKSKSLPLVPELMVDTDTLSERFLYAINDLKGKDPDDLSMLNVVIIWMAFAGMGAVVWWDKNWKYLSNNGIFETLTKDSVDDMDEYVYQLIGIEYNSSEGTELREWLQNTARIFLDKTDRFYFSDKYAKYYWEDLYEMGKAMYIFGMVFEMNRLGMM